MFHTSYVVAYVVLNLVIYIQLVRLAPAKGLKAAFTVFYLLLAGAFPFAERLSHQAVKGLPFQVLKVSDYALPYLLYLAMAVLAFDILLVLNALRGKSGKALTKGRGFKTAAFWTVLAVPLAVVLYGSINYGHITVNTYHISVPRRSSAVGRLRIAMAADFHLRAQTSASFLPRFVAKIDELAPDIVLIPGDIFEGDRPDEATAEFEKQFKRIKVKYGVYASPGNHESFRGASGAQGFFERAGIRMLRDEVVKIDDAFLLAGRNYSRRDNRKTLGTLLEDAPADFPVVVMDHAPLRLQQVGQSATPPDIQVSGHTHYGQLFPLNIVTRLQYELAWGHKRIGRTHFFVTCGIQAWGPPLKTAGNSEIMLIDVAFGKLP